jgi:hypothetical protein
MSGFSYSSNDHLVRTNLWSAQLKEVFQADLMAMKYVDIITDFPDGDTLNIPSIGQAEVLDYAEGQAVRYTAMDTGNFTFSIDQYKSSATYITERMKQDSFYMSRLVSSFVPKQNRAIQTSMESKILSVGPDGQTSSNLNQINGASHRFIGSGTNEVMAPQDFAKALYALEKANVPLTNLVAVVDPSVEYNLNTLSNLVNVSNNPRWEGIISSGHVSGMRFVKNIYGFDVYVSQFLKLNTGSETINSITSTVGVNNLFFSADSTALPIVGAIRQAPKVDSEYNKDLQREEYVTTARYAFKLYRPENMVCVVTDTDQV